jgi:ketosteroid isomerase-like protein
MSQENVETYRRVVAAFNRGGDPHAQELLDPEGPQAQELFDPEVRIEPLLAGGVEGAVYRGRAGAVEFVSQLNEVFAEVHADYSRIEEFNEVLLVSGKTTGRGRKGGAPVEQPWFSAIRFRQGKIIYAAFRLTRAEALEAVGLQE